MPKAKLKVKIDRELLLKVAENARIKLSEKQVQKLIPEVQEILQAFSKIDELNTEKTKPSFQPLQLKNVWREDKPGKCLTQEQALSLTQHKKNGYFKGPRVV